MERPKKLQRISQACDLCHRRSIRCRPSAENPQRACQNCYDFNVECTYNRPSRRRRNQAAQSGPPNVLPGQTLASPRSENARGESSRSTPHGTTRREQPDYTGAYGAVREGAHDELQGLAWRSFAAARLNVIDQYMEVYMDAIHPLFPFYHRPTLLEQLRKRRHLTDRSLFASIMAACALTASRIRDGATDRRQLGSDPDWSSEVFFAAAQDAVYQDLNMAKGIGFMQACGLLALTSIQYGQIRMMHLHLGTYHTLRAMQRFHNEDHWPAGLSVIEKEERRRLFWSMYSVDIFISVTFDAVIKSEETHSNVRYPSESSDEDLSAGVSTPSSPESWLRGWNFCVDLYRILEHTVKRMRRFKQPSSDKIAVTRMLINDDVPEGQIMEQVMAIYYELPERFRNSSLPVTGDMSHDIYGFQMANIQATLQMVRMTLFSMDYSHDVYQRCNVAEQVLTTFHGISPYYLRAISTPLVYHLGSIGKILASVMEGRLCEESYLRVRGLLVSMADLLQGLESGLQPTAGASREMRKQIDKIDRYMEAQRRILPSSQQPQAQQQPHQAPQTQQSRQLPQRMPPSLPMPEGMPGPATAFDEFQLPTELVSSDSWPWPFDFTAEQQLRF
ncbi:hypothetical protein K470DRAFT_218099 [Piedraia hortae CBS 480.64]|uniref:Zn(2)-C6 fungal-type domain-containing protein n=1 Tax=Piedraia hortae CBS 480.64 TaxID=1314780 RepID=A0A6A7BYF9_9PEZI|nr:hypothetical protein K470DRAFT_218099 [Piedraia hortae CBS 480.64]